MGATAWLALLSVSHAARRTPVSKVVGWSQNNIVALTKLLSNPVGPLKTLLEGPPRPPRRRGLAADTGEHRIGLSCAVDRSLSQDPRPDEIVAAAHEPTKQVSSPTVTTPGRSL
jgi:hypothetical protein